MDIDIKDYSEWIDKPCPKCGASLLTKEDYKSFIRLKRFASLINFVFPKANPDKEKVSFDVKMNGTGNMEFDLKDNNN